MEEETPNQPNDKSAEDTPEFAPGCKTVIEFSDKTCRAMMTATKGFQKLPPAGSPIWDLRKSYPEFNRGLKGLRNRMIANMTKIIGHAKIPIGDFKRRDVDEKFDFLVEVNDDLLERIGTSLDHEEGLFKRAEILVVNAGAGGSGNPPGVWKEKKLERLNAGPLPEQSSSFSQISESSSGGITSRKIKRAVFRTGRVKVKPQEQFTTPIDNSVGPFVPQLTDKPHSLKPLSILPEYNEDNQEFYGHPYDVEINHWKPHEDMIAPTTPRYPSPLEKTPLMMVSTLADLDQMIQELCEVNEIGVDLEHHSYRSFQGFTCLIQISSRTKDYVVDSLALRDELQKLNIVFANPKILKIFHGAQMDIVWLQRDFSVYVVGMFDTSVAASLLDFPQKSYQYLLTDICKTSTDKTYQLADWRLRPLPDDMVEYARKDTHYLPYIYDVLKNRLLEASAETCLLHTAYEQSRAVCLKRYEKPHYNPQVAIRKCKKSFNNRQLHGFIELFKWRDTIARQFDESPGFVLPNHMLQTIAETLPKEMTGILACCDPIPFMVNQHLAVIHEIVSAARELPLHTQEASMQQKAQRKTRSSNWLHILDSHHDYGAAKGHSISTLYQRDNSGEDAVEWWSCVDASDMQIKGGPVISFNCAKSQTTSPNSAPKSQYLVFSPFERYRITREIVQQLRDPGKKDTVNMNDPMVQSVVQTIEVEAPEVEEEEEEVQQDNVSRKSTLFDQDFVPFNPMSRVETNQRGKKRKHEDEASEDPHPAKEPKFEPKSILDSILDGSEPSDDDDNKEDVKKFVAVPNGSKESKSSKKRKRKNFLKRLANRGKKRKYDVTDVKDEDMEDGELEESGEIVPESSTSTYVPNPHARNSPYNRNGKNKNNKRGRGNNNSPNFRNGNDNNPHGNQNQNPKKKRGWFRGKRENEGKSLTFKRQS